MDCTLPSSSLHGIFQAIVLEWISISLLQGIFLTQGSNPGFPHCRQMLYHLNHQGKKAEHWRIDALKTVVLEKTLESPLVCKEIKPINPKGNQSWIFIGRTDAEAETPIFWPLYVKNWLIWKDPDAVKDWGQEEKGMKEDEMVGWHHQLDGHEFEQTLGDSEWQGSLACCSPWGCKELDTTERLNNNYMPIKNQWIQQKNPRGRLLLPRLQKGNWGTG